jgi:exopolysaccharide biosynthesis polyprenyl glycosylphosphotransferase
VTGADVAVLTASFGLAYVVRGLLGYGALLPFHMYLWVLAIVVFIWLALGRAMGLTASHTYGRVAQAVTTTLKAHAAASLALLSALYLLKATDVSRLLIQTFLVIGAVALVVERVTIHVAIVRLAERWNTGTRRWLVVGQAAMAEALHRLLKQHPHWGAAVAGVATDEPFVPVEGAVPVLGGVNDIDAILDAAVFDEVVMADRITAHQHGTRILSACVERGLTYHTLVRMPDHGSGRHHAEALGNGVYLISVETAPQDPIALSAKRAIDLLGGCVGLVLCAVAFVVLAVPIRLASGGAVIFRQTRVGRNGRLFTVYKFRTMRSNAEREQAGLLAANEMRGPLFKLRNDPRVTSVGRWLRRTYLDELPQFWNVLKGDMSLVGTRPPTPEEVSRYSASQRRRLSVRPGITGLWQVQGNGSITDFDTVVRLDCDYIDRWSLLLDLKIMLQTCVTVARRAGH